MNRRRHFDTVAWFTSSFAATARLVAPFAHSNTIRDRCANECGVLSRRDVTSWWLVPTVVVATLTLTLIRMAPPAAAEPDAEVDE
jgi:hypothetical protein